MGINLVRQYGDHEEFPKTWEYPVIEQLHNTCGLASLLMMLDLPNNARISQFLTDITQLIAPLIRQLDKIDQALVIGAGENQNVLYQYSLQYLLLKILASKTFPSIQNYFSERFGSLYEDQKILSNHILTAKSERFLDQDELEIAKAYDEYILDGRLINPVMMEDETHTMKTDLELKLLMELFGYEFIPIESGDHTGALYFTQKNAWSNIKDLVNAHLNHYPILYGSDNHWMAVVGLYPNTNRSWTGRKGIPNYKIAPRDYNFVYNDPIVGSRIQRRLKGLQPSQRFYIFRPRIINLTNLYQDIKNHILEDISDEILLISNRFSAIDITTTKRTFQTATTLTPLPSVPKKISPTNLFSTNPVEISKIERIKIEFQPQKHLFETDWTDTSKSGSLSNEETSLWDDEPLLDNGWSEDDATPENSSPQNNSFWLENTRIESGVSDESTSKSKLQTSNRKLVFLDKIDEDDVFED